jgi:hypothetical protein
VFLSKPLGRNSQCLLFVPLLVLSLLGSAGTSQESPKAPLSEEDILALATSCKLGEISSSRVVDVIRERGLAFSVSDIFLLELETREADPSIGQALRKIRDQGRDFAPTATKTQETELRSPAATAPFPPAAVSSKIPDEQTWPRFLEAVRAKALAYTDDLPNFICTQITTRSERIYPGGWHQVDNFVADLTYFEKKENYKIISVANRPTSTATLDSLKGSWSTGEFGSSLRMLFDLKSNAAFRLEGVDQANGRETVRISYQVPKETSSSTITYNNEQTIITAYRGRCWIDPESFNVVRLEEKAINIPENFPITRAEKSIDYDLQDIAGRKFWLPIRAEMLLVQRAVNFHARNVIEFKKYRKFEAEVKIVPD